MNLFEKIKEIFLRNKNKRLICDDLYAQRTMSIDDIGLIDSFERKLSDKMIALIKSSDKNVYDYPLDTKISEGQLSFIVRSFFENINSEFSYKINNILGGIDTKFVLNIGLNVKNNSLSNPNNGYPLELQVRTYGDLRDVYGLVHELTHCLDIDNKDTSTRIILGEVAPQCMERLLDIYLLENCDNIGLDKEKLKRDIEKRKLTTFISRAKNAISFNNEKRRNLDGRTINQEMDSRYVIAQIYQTELMKNDYGTSKKKLINFINCVNNDNFNGANKALGINIERENKLQRDNLISNTIKENETRPVGK